MSVSNNRHGHSHDEFVTGFRLQWQARTMANTDVVVLGADAAPVQLLSITTAATLRLPLEAKDGKVFIVKSAAAGGTGTVTDNAGSPNTVGTIATGTSGVFIKKGPAGSGTYEMILESAAIA